MGLPESAVHATATASHKLLPRLLGPICGGINRSNSSAKYRTIQVALSTWRAAAGIVPPLSNTQATNIAGRVQQVWEIKWHGIDRGGASSSRARGSITGNFVPSAEDGNIYTIADMRVLDDKDVVRLLRSEVKRAGGQSAWARREGTDRTLLNRILNGQRPPTKEIIRALKLCNVYALDDEGIGN